MIIALEGGICGGKTSLAKELTKYSYLMVPEYMDFITPAEQQQLDNLHNAGENALGLLLKIEKRRKDTYLNKSSNIVLDRSFLTLFAYEYAMNGDDCSRFLADKKIMSQVIQPDLVVYLDVMVILVDKDVMTEEILICRNFIWMKNSIIKIKIFSNKNKFSNIISQY